jgi:hypothetical protein
LSDKDASNLWLYARKEDVLGKSWEDWTIIGWQWLQEQPKICNPVVDENGIYSANGQNHGDMWFLAGTINSQKYGTKPPPYERNCNIPTERSVAVPVDISCLTLAESKNFSNSLNTMEDLAKSVRADIDSIREMEFSIEKLGGDRDRLKLRFKELSEYRVMSPDFTVTFPEKNIWDVQPGPTYARADGYWVFLKPLPQGKYKIHFFGRSNTFYTEVTYNIDSK